MCAFQFFRLPIITHTGSLKEIPAALFVSLNSRNKSVLSTATKKNLRFIPYRQPENLAFSTNFKTVFL